MVSKVAKDRESRMREYTDASEEYKATRSEEARVRRHRAMMAGSPEDTRRAGEKFAGEAWQEGRDRKERLREIQFSGWRKKS